ncbi:MAG: hypothetical protein Q6K80_12455 [Thermostichus sp. DG_1_6_bins_120]
MAQLEELTQGEIVKVPYQTNRSLCLTAFALSRKHRARIGAEVSSVWAIMWIPTALISLATPNLLRLQGFYRALLGIPAQVQLPQEGEPVYVEFRLPGLRLGLYRSHHPDFAARAGAMSLCLQVEDLQGSLSGIQAVLAEYQLVVSPVRQDFHGQEVDFVDPDGNRIVLHQPSASFWQAMDWDPQA